MTVADLSDRMTTAEFARWVAFDELAAFDREMAQREAEMKAKARG
jgi:hypothetical protein